VSVPPVVGARISENCTEHERLGEKQRRRLSVAAQEKDGQQHDSRRVTGRASGAAGVQTLARGSRGCVMMEGWRGVTSFFTTQCHAHRGLGVGWVTSFFLTQCHAHRGLGVRWVTSFFNTQCHAHRGMEGGG